MGRHRTEESRFGGEYLLTSRSASEAEPSSGLRNFEPGGQPDEPIDLRGAGDPRLDVALENDGRVEPALNRLGRPRRYGRVPSVNYILVGHSLRIASLAIAGGYLTGSFAEVRRDPASQPDVFIPSLTPRSHHVDPPRLSDSACESLHRIVCAISRRASYDSSNCPPIKWRYRQRASDRRPPTAKVG